ncbi:MAG TPA: hypothetical protein PKO15_13340 [Fibrobacteria bacterium]|nr:hypothetical protein [Fibrobacteria bacterium]
MIPFGMLVWHLGFVVLLLVVWRLSVRLGRAMRDDVGSLILFPVSAGLIAIASVCWQVSSLAPMAVWLAFGIDLVAGGLSWYAAIHCWGWLWNELRGSASSEG